MKGIKLHATRNHPSASASKRKVPKSRPSVAKKTKRDSLDQTEDLLLLGNVGIGMLT